MARRLHRICVKCNTLFPAYRADFGDGLNGAYLIVGIHDCYKAGVLPDGLLHLLGGYDAVGMDIQQFNLIAFPLQLFQSMQDGMVFHGCGNDMPFSCLRTRSGGGKNCLIIRLAAARRKDDFFGRGVKAGRNAYPGIFQCLSSLLSGSVQAGGVVPNIFHRQKYGLDDCRGHFSGCRIIHIDHFIRILSHLKSWKRHRQGDASKL